MKNPTDAEGAQGRFIIPAAMIAAGLASQPALSAPGDLDPSFGSVGRASLPSYLEGAVWALEASVDGEYTFAGGDDGYCDYYYENCFDSFTGSLSETGQPNPGFATTVLDSVEVHGVARQLDRRQVAVGRAGRGQYRLIAYRIMPDGSKDATFGTDGSFVLAGESSIGKAVEIDAAGRIVIAGIEDSRVIVLRLMPNGTLDGSFGEAGVFRGPYVAGDHVDVDLAKAPDGGYRLLSYTVAGCLVAAIADNGALDERFGQLGTAVVGPGGYESNCLAMVVQPDGRVIVGGAVQAGAIVARLRADGTADPTFVGADVQSQLAQVFSLALAGDGSVIAGVSEKDSSPGAVAVRLRPNGTLDPGFGIAGRARIDVETDGTASHAEARVVRVLRNGGVLVGGSFHQVNPNVGQRPFIARLLAAGAGPGVLGFNPSVTEVDEKDQRAVFTVRRTGGVAGAVSVAYETAAGSAQPGVDFTPVAGRLNWADGDNGERSITVPIVSGDTDAELEEHFSIALNDPRGGAGIGSGSTSIKIRGDGYPFGMLTIVEGSVRVAEPAISGSYTTLQVLIRRENYYSGPVSVTALVQPGSATPGDDFEAAPVTLTWGNGELGDRAVVVNVLSDKLREGDETFSIVLSAPTGGAVLGKSSVTATIADTKQAGSGSGGGGQAGLLTLFALGIARLLRARRA